MWRSVGFLMSFAVVMEGMTLVAYIVLISGGKQKREQGWKVICGMLFLVGMLQCAGMALIVGHSSSSRTRAMLTVSQAWLYDNDDRFFPGWRLDTSWTLCTISWVVSMLCAVGIVTAKLTLPAEGGYELIPDYNEYDS